MPDDRPKEWRPEWRKPKARKNQRAGLRVARARMVEPLPTPEQMRQEALAVLREIALDREAPAPSRVGAAGRLIEAVSAPGSAPVWKPSPFPVDAEGSETQGPSNGEITPQASDASTQIAMTHAQEGDWH